ncbi:hypothetical protein SpiGrapes_2238 [Sphaerochaeta pleomorpha str. Grapes]|uniref:Uncharacterized protein n=1 Tax=Sphaerochaeta pleomorpha (strain ATCC BAA-1885 / DSM 22778 / Grapes) TaxID=158190 RepID=G8QS16_SPHPG|nr:hypothetical protein [Sphaerochaeta pleomorpha]AEV30014.1 hypothetical protein SpiGrapes_2238 [Sphaerochaeta pleomorpha str. Grapes]
MKKIIVVCLLLFYSLASAAAFSGFDAIFSDATEETDSSAKDFSWKGKAEVSLEGFPKGGMLDPAESISFDLEWNTSRVQTSASLSFSNTLQWDELLTDLSLTTFVKNVRIEAGFLTKEWGSGDGVHVVDVPNALDYTNGITDDLLAMKVPEPMVIVSSSWGNTALELLYKPIFTPMKTSMEGRWSLLPATFFAPDGTKATITDSQTSKLSYSQFGSRLSTVWGPSDISFIYFNGYYSQPGYKNLVFDFSDPLHPYVTSVEVQYTKAQLFGTALTVVAGPYTLMFEGGYYLSEDKEGTDPTLYNSKWVYEAGIGMFLFGTSTYGSLMYNGHRTDHFDQVDVLAGDVDAYQAYGGKAYGNTLTAALEIPFARDTLSLRLAGTYQIETKGYAFLPSLQWEISDSLVFTAKGRLFGNVSGDEGNIFKTWDENDSVSIGISFLF